MMIAFEEKINEISKRMKEIFDSEQMKKIKCYSKILSNLVKLGKDYNWVVVTPDVDTNIANACEAEINDYFVSLLDGDSSLYKNIKTELLACDYMRGKSKLMEQIFYSIKCENYWIACVALSTMLEFLLAKESNFNSIKMSVLLDNFIDNVGYISISEYEVGFLYSLDGFLNNYITPTNGFEKEKEPKYINRHWTAHGRMYRELTKIDTYQVLFAIYALVRVMDMEKRVKLQAEND